MRFELFIATRYLRAKRRQAFIGVITGISVLGVAAGVASLIVALAINNGFRQDLQARLLGSTAHISLLRVKATAYAIGVRCSISYRSSRTWSRPLRRFTSRC
jgi:lipoprotein-releasing system permease protein